MGHLASGLTLRRCSIQLLSACTASAKDYNSVKAAILKRYHVNALDSYSALAPASAKDYNSVKAAILKRYDVNADTYQQKFRLETRKRTESYHNFGERLTDLLGCWESAAEGTELRELVLLEQFLQALLKDMAVRVREGKPKTIKEASKMADNYELACTAARGGAVQRQQQGLDQTSNAGSLASAANMKP